MKTIYNTYVVMESQEQCDRMKQLCIDNGLDIPSGYKDFEIDENNNLFQYSELQELFFVFSTLNKGHKNIYLVTEQEFIELLKTTKQ